MNASSFSTLTEAQNPPSEWRHKTINTRLHNQASSLHICRVAMDDAWRIKSPPKRQRGVEANLRHVSESVRYNVHLFTFNFIQLTNANLSSNIRCSRKTSSYQFQTCVFSSGGCFFGNEHFRSTFPDFLYKTTWTCWYTNSHRRSLIGINVPISSAELALGGILILYL
jgi:hypothetical protein